MKRLLLVIFALSLLILWVGCSGSASSDPAIMPTSNGDDLDSGKEDNATTIIGTFESEPDKDFDFTTNGFKLHIPAGALSSKFKVVVSKSASASAQSSLNAGFVAAGELFNVVIESAITSSSLLESLLGASSQLVLQKPARVTLVLNALRIANTDYFIGHRNDGRWEIISPESDTSLELVMQTFNPRGDFCTLQRKLGVSQTGLKDMRLSITPLTVVASSSGKLSSDLFGTLQIKNSSGSGVSFSQAQVQMFVSAVTPFEFELKHAGEGSTKLASSLSDSGYQVNYSMLNQTYVAQTVVVDTASLTFQVKLLGKELSSVPSVWQFKAAYSVDNITYTAENLVGFVGASLPTATSAYVLSSTPADKSSDVSVNTQIILYFDKSINAASVSSSSVTIAIDNVPVSGMFEVQQNVIKFTPAEKLPYGQKVDVSVQSDVWGTDNQPVSPSSLSFSTESLPSLVAYSPVISTGVPVNQQIQATFSKAMNKDSVVANFKVARQVDSSLVAGSFTWAADSKSVVFVPSSSLSYNSTYTVEIGVNAIDVNTNPLIATATWQFLTEATPVEAAYVTVTSPLNDASDVLITSLIEVTFSREIRTESLSADNFVVSIGGLPVAGSLTSLSDKVTFTPGSSFSYNSLVKVEIKNSLLDVNGRSVEPYFFSFTTDTRPEVLAYSPTSELNSAISVTSSIEVIYSKPMNQNQTELVFQMKKADDLSNVNGNFTWSSDSKAMVFSPAVSLSYYATYSVEIGQNAVDESGNTLAATTTWQFVTTAGQLPTFTSEPSITRISQSSASATCDVAIANGTDVSQKGMVWGTSQNPTLESYVGKTEIGANAGAIVSSLSGLSAGTLYYLRAYAVNSAGTAYSAEKSFTTYTNTGGSGGLFAGGDGSDANPFQIVSVTQLNNIQNGSGSSYIITSDFTIPDGASGRNATFTGKLSGNGFEITNYSAYPLFERVDYTSEISMLRVDANPQTFFLDRYGTVAGLNYGSIKSCEISLTLSYEADSFQGPIGGIVGGNVGNISDSNVKGDIKLALSSFGCGGVSGYNATDSVIINCEFEGSINSLTIYGAGGIVGLNQNGSIVDCVASSSIVTSSIFAGSGGGGGGISGASSGFVSGSTARGTIATGSGALNYIFGGIVGDNTDGTIVNCSNFTNLSSDTGN